ncbi:MAG: PASTA domain-containing protein [Agathobacter sp.]
MNGNDFLEKIEMLDDDLVEAAGELPIQRTRPMIWKYGVVAACACLLGGVVLVSTFLGIKSEKHPSGDLVAQESETATDNRQDEIQQIVTGTENETSSEIEEPVILANASYLTFDINPSFQLTIDEGVVVDYLAINDDGEDILRNIEVIGKKVEDALPLVIGELVEQGYLAKKEFAPVLLLSARGGDGAAQLLEEAVFISQDALVEKEVEVFIVAQQIENPDELEVLAEKYGVSVGKMQYVLNVLREESNISVEDATAYTVIELFGMDIEKRLIEPPYKVGDYDEYGEKVLFVGSVESYVGYVPWDKLSEEYKKELEALYTPEALEILAKPRVWTTMPGVVGLPADEALKLLYSRNIAPMICYEDNPNARIAGYTDGMVFKQDIPQGTRWPSDACVHIWILVSENASEQQVPIQEHVEWEN